VRARRSAALGLALVALTGLALLPAASGRGAAVRLQLEPEVALRDVPLDVRMTGLEPDERVTIRGEERSKQGRAWRSELSARADASGAVVLRNALLEGLMRPVDGSPSADGYPRMRSTIRVTVLDGRNVLAEATAVRVLRPPGIRVKDVRGPIYAEYVTPPGSARGAPILFLGGSEGGLPNPAAPFLLAAHGHPVLVLAYFSEPGLPARLHNIPLEYFQRALEWLGARPELHGRPIVVAGVSRGGEAALLVGATYPELVAGVIALVPSDSVHAAPDDSFVAAWTDGGKRIDPQPIAIERIAGPIFAVGALHDALWRSGDAVAGIRRRLAGHALTPTILAFPFAGHAVGTIVPNIATETQLKTRYGWLSFGGTRTADERGREQAWPRMLDWLARIR
jgi:dienelactone hydrolase